MNVTVDLSMSGQAGTDLPSAGQLQQWATIALQMATAAGHFTNSPERPVQLSVRLVDEAESAQLNAHYRGKNHATNVLSFPGQLPEAVQALLPELLLGDLAICPAVVDREAAQQHKSSSAHWTHMLVHGLLHLLGLDHQTGEEAQIMEHLEIDILKILGHPDPYLIPEQRSSVSQ